jgi:hypothetical protein
MSKRSRRDREHESLLAEMRGGDEPPVPTPETAVKGTTEPGKQDPQHEVPGARARQAPVTPAKRSWWQRLLGRAAR